MTKIKGIERLEGLGITARVTDAGCQFSTYASFAKRIGYPDAAASVGEENIKSRELRERKEESFKVLAKGLHETYLDTYVTVIESKDGKRFLINEEGLDFIENVSAPKSLELRSQAEELLAEIRRQAYAEGYEQAKKDAEAGELFRKVGRAARDTITKISESYKETAQQKRDLIVEQAKVDIKELSTTYKSVLAGNKVSFWPKESERDGFAHTHNVEFVVNSEKRTVVALVKYIDNRVDRRGIAKCAPGDCFNAHIGKAIALRRALGLEVPDEYIYAPQPTEVRVGDVIKVNLENGGEDTRKVIKVDNRKGVRLNVILPGRMIEFPSSYAELVDDSREEADAS